MVYGGSFVADTYNMETRYVGGEDYEIEFFTRQFNISSQSEFGYAHEFQPAFADEIIRQMFE